MYTYDIIIIGSGIVGLTVAGALRESGLKIAIVDANAPPTEWLDKSYDLRVNAITPASQTIFSSLNVWPSMVEQRISAFNKMHVWGAQGEGKIDFDCAAVGEENLGYIIENRVLQSALYKNLEADFISGTLQELQVEDNLVKIELTNGDNIIGKLIVGADGAESQVRQLANISFDCEEYGHSGLVATVRCSLPHAKTAWQRFLPNGILAFLPLAEANLCSIVWSTKPAEMERLSKLENTEFCRLLGEVFEQRLGNIIDTSERRVFPLFRRHVKQYVVPRIALIGDAAHTLHPLAGQGVNLGILDAASLAEIILAAVEKKQDIGSLALLRRYERWRKGENLVLLITVGALKDLFNSENIFLKKLRMIGMNSMDKMLLLKNYIMQRAMGQIGDLPELAKKHV